MGKDEGGGRMKERKKRNKERECNEWERKRNLKKEEGGKTVWD